jgi:hypothetical protein
VNKDPLPPISAPQQGLDSVLPADLAVPAKDVRFNAAKSAVFALKKI